MEARFAGLAVVAAAVLLAGCSSGTTAEAADPGVRAGDPSYAFSQLRKAPSADEGLVPTTLSEALPNHRIAVRGTDDLATFSDALVVGTVTEVAKGHGVVWRDDDDFTVVDFDDARADTRTAYVTVAPDDAVGSLDGGAGAVTFRVVLPSSSDPDAFVAGLAGLTRVAVLLQDDPNAAEVPRWRPILGDRTIGVVAADGSLSLPAMAHGFAGGLRTAEQLLAAARRPVTTTTVKRA